MNTNIKLLNRVCYTVCILCIVGGTALTFSMIWGKYQSEYLWKAWVSIAVLFFASVATLVVSKLLGGKGGEPTGAV
jgi:hypothetical protein